MSTFNNSVLWELTFEFLKTGLCFYALVNQICTLHVCEYAMYVFANWCSLLLHTFDDMHFSKPVTHVCTLVWSIDMHVAFLKTENNFCMTNILKFKEEMNFFEETS